MTFLYCSLVRRAALLRPRRLKEVLHANEEKNKFDWQYISITQTGDTENT